MKKLLVVLTIGLFAIGCLENSDHTDSAVDPTPLMQTAFVDTPPPAPEVDPAYQADQGATQPSDTIVSNTGYSRRQLDSIGKSKMGSAKHEPGKSKSMPHDPPKQK